MMNDNTYSKFNYVRNRNKLLANLISIIDGFLSDGKLTEEEILFLDTWLLEANDIQQNVIFQHIREEIYKITQDGIVSQSELNELKFTLLDIQKSVLDLPNIDLYSKESDVHLLSGLCKGVIADSRLNDEEIHYLKWWLDNNLIIEKQLPR